MKSKYVTISSHPTKTYRYTIIKDNIILTNSACGCLAAIFRVRINTVVGYQGISGIYKKYILTNYL